MMTRSILVCALFASLAIGGALAACGSDNNGGNGDSGDGSPFGDGNPFSDGGPGDGGSGCGTYEILCNGVCTSTSDPKNSGGCGVTCPANQVCSAGGCASGCLPGLQACNGTCVDTNVDNANCGTCGHPCGANQGCVGGACVNGVSFSNPKCPDGGGPPVIVDDGDAGTCTGNLSKKTFNWTICSCNNINATSALYADGWDSTKGPYKPKQIAGGLAANKSVQSSDTITDYGKMNAAASTGTSISSSNVIAVYDEVQNGSNWSTGNDTAGANVYSAGNISGGSLDIAGTLFQPTGKTHGGVTYKTLTNQAVTVNPQCNCTNKIPVAAIVAWAKTHNDDTTVGLDPGLLTKATSTVHVDFPCGSYYLTGFTTGVPVAIVVHGNTAIFIDGNLTTNDQFEITLSGTNATLDLFVSGTISPSAQITIGNSNWPALTHVYVGSAQSFTFSSETLISGNVWAGYATVDWASTSDMFGAIFSNDFTMSSELNIHYDQGVTHSGTDCNDAGPPGPPAPW
jgi:hypothetical protein